MEPNHVNKQRSPAPFLDNSLHGRVLWTSLMQKAILIHAGVAIALGPAILAEEPLPLGSQRELFVDHYLIDRLEGR